MSLTGQRQLSVQNQSNRLLSTASSSEEGASSYAAMVQGGSSKSPRDAGNGFVYQCQNAKSLARKAWGVGNRPGG